MKKLIALILTLVLVCTLFTACGAKSGSDLKYIKDKGTLIVGITDYAPMDFKDENGNWTGFDAEFAEMTAEALGVKCEFFVLADWGKKFFELESKNIDVIWNGMTITEEVKLNTNCSAPYVVNAQVLVMKAERLAQYDSVEKLNDLTFAVENGSAGQAAVEGIGISSEMIVATQDQAAALREVAAGTSDACVIDITMANAMTGEGTDYANLATGIALTSEEYGIGCRKESDLTAEIDNLMAKWKEDGTLQALADKYGLTLAD